MHKKATKDVKEQLDAVEGPTDKIKFLQQKYLDKVHEANKLERQNASLQVWQLPRLFPSCKPCQADP